MTVVSNGLKGQEGLLLRIKRAFQTLADKKIGVLYSGDSNDNIEISQGFNYMSSTEDSADLKVLSSVRKSFEAMVKSLRKAERDLARKVAGPSKKV